MMDLLALLPVVKGTRLQHESTTDKIATSKTLFGPDNPYVQFLLARRDRVFFMKPYNGNSGDLLIWLGTEHLLQDLQLSRTLDPRAADIIVLPGGNQTMWQANVNIWKEIGTKWPDKEFVIGPTTIRLGNIPWQEEIRTSVQNMTGLFARDPESYETLRQCELSDRITIGLSHDPALYLRDSDLILAHRAAGTEDYVLASFRTDHERATDSWARLKRWRGLLPAFIARRLHLQSARSREREWVAQVARYTHSTKPIRVCDASAYIFECFVEIVRSAAEVHTDRLHCMLLAAMLGKPTFAYPTAYGKLEAIYNYSVKDWAYVECISELQSASSRRAGRQPVASASLTRP